MKVKIPPKAIEFALNFIDLDTPGTDCRTYEYSYAISRANCYSTNSILLDVGCTARINVIPATMCELGWNVIGVDYRKYYYCHENFIFYNMALSQALSYIKKNSIDVVTAISTIEHIGLESYKHNGNKEDDKLVIAQIAYVLKKHNTFILSVPFTKKEIHIINKSARVYNDESIKCLLAPYFRIINSQIVTIKNQSTIMIEAIKL
jgi:hypothetical protein